MKLASKIVDIMTEGLPPEEMDGFIDAAMLDMKWTKTETTHYGGFTLVLGFRLFYPSVIGEIEMTFYNVSPVNYRVAPEITVEVEGNHERFYSSGRDSGYVLVSDLEWFRGRCQVLVKDRIVPKARAGKLSTRFIRLCARDLVNTAVYRNRPPASESDTDALKARIKALPEGAIDIVRVAREGQAQTSYSSMNVDDVKFWNEKIDEWERNNPGQLAQPPAPPPDDPPYPDV